MSKRLLLVGGSVNGIFTAFHIWLGWQIQMLPDLLPDYKALMQMLNVGVVLMIAFATFVSFFCRRDLLTTNLGKTTLILIALFYTVRAAEEIFLATSFSPVIFGICLAVALIYLQAIIGALRKPGAEA
jgi:ABC-type phosphate/phosphonate transport system permease subunit